MTLERREFYTPVEPIIAMLNDLKADRREETIVASDQVALPVLDQQPVECTDIGRVHDAQPIPSRWPHRSRVENRRL
jgi:hypothetical protein